MENNFPEKFKNQDGTLNSESLLKSYTELEKKIGTMVSVPDESADEESLIRFRRAIGVPDSANEYPDDPMFSDTPDIKEKFREIGLSKKQVESVYKLASEFLSPVLTNIISAKSESDNISELKTFFGGDEKMLTALTDLDGFAKKNLSEDAYDALCSSADGIKTIYKMMQSREPNIAMGGNKNDSLSDTDLRQMMRDPRYWRDRDDEFVRKIETGFKKLYS